MRHYSFHSICSTVLGKHGISSTASNVKALASLREITWHRYDWQRVNYYQDLHLTSDEVELLKDACELGLCFSMTNNGITEILIETKVKNILDEINYTIACLEEEDKPIQELGIDIETYSSNDLPGCGVYKYVEADDFQILLFAYSINNGPVHMVDLACGEELPSKVKEALTDPAVLKTAYNAAFERICLSRWLGMPTGEYLAPEQWDCTMVRAARLGMPMSLDKCGQVLGIERPKMKEGAALIRYFSIPCKPTKANGGRTRNLPEHAPEKWATFKAYCIRDVEAEQQIRDRVKKKPVTEKETKLWFIDQHINDRGVLIDLKLARNAADMDAEAKERLFQEAQEITGLANPNSVVQLKEFIERKEGHKIPAIRKEEIKELIKTCKNSDVRRVLEIRLELGKTSNNKYQTMLDCACDDGRVRGITQFYGAARTGRWAGRLLQTQNLPQNHIPDLDYARSLVLNGDYDDVDLMYGNVTQTLSELIRTALIAKPRTTFHVCDFSAIECRVLAWLAGEEWVLDNFRKGGDIYCATASQMFHVPVEKHGQNAELRQKGKVATLACIAENELVLTDKGLIPIQNVTAEHKLWDGESWITHGGVIYKGIKEVIEYEGLKATPDHVVWVKGQQEPVQFGQSAASGSHLVQTGDGGEAIRMGENNIAGKKMDQELAQSNGVNRMHRLWRGTMDALIKLNKRYIKGLPKLLSAKTNTLMARQTANCSKRTLPESKGPAICELRSARGPIYLRVSDGRWVISDKEVRPSGQEPGNRQDRQQQRLFSREHQVRNKERECRQQADNSSFSLRAKILALCRKYNKTSSWPGPYQGSNYREGGTGGTRKEKVLARYCGKVKVYDIRNAGRHNRYTVSNKLVHNCGYGGGQGALAQMGGARMGMTEQEMKDTVKQWRAANPHIVKFWANVERACIYAVTNETECELKSAGLKFSYKWGGLAITLPSGRFIYYPKMRKEPDAVLSYEGMNQVTKKWERVDTYGGKITENITQAVARDCLAEVMRTMSDKGIQMVFHVHDEIISECDPSVTSLQDIEKYFGMEIPWAKGLPLKGAGYTTNYYKKD